MQRVTAQPKKESIVLEIVSISMMKITHPYLFYRIISDGIQCRFKARQKSTQNRHAEKHEVVNSTNDIFMVRNHHSYFTFYTEEREREIERNRTQRNTVALILNKNKTIMPVVYSLLLPKYPFYCIVKNSSQIDMTRVGPYFPCITTKIQDSC